MSSDPDFNGFPWAFCCVQTIWFWYL